MTIIIQAEPVPLFLDENSQMRFNNSRVTLDSVINLYKQNASAEEIQEAFPTLALADIYAVITYYLRHTEQVEEYLSEQSAEAAKVRQKIEVESNFPEFRQKLFDRWNKLHPNDQRTSNDTSSNC